MIKADNVFRVPRKTREGQPLSETRTADRGAVTSMHDKIFLSGRVPYVRRVLRAYDVEGKGNLTPDQLRSALDRLNTGMDPGEKDR